MRTRYTTTLLLVIATLAPELVRGQVPEWVSDIDAVVEDYGRRRTATDLDCPWELAHHLLAFGAHTKIVCAIERTDLIGYLLVSAKGRGGPLFLRRNTNALVPMTDFPPKQTYQDHRNQLLACAAIVTGLPGSPTSRPGSVNADTWQAMLRGAWEDCSLDDEPSWTLVCYVRYLPDLPAPRAEVLDRIEKIVRSLVDPHPRFPLACGGSHALYALAEYLRSPYAQELDAKLNDIVRGVLETGVKEFLESATRRLDGNAAPSLPLDSLGNMISDEGHSLEWLVVYLAEERLQQPDLVAVVQRLTRFLRDTARFELSPPGGALHAVHGLRSYSEKLKRSRQSAPGTTRHAEQMTSEAK